MKGFSVLALAFVPIAILGLTEARAGECRSKIMTAETALARLSEDGATAADAKSAGDSLWRIDEAAAREQLSKASAYLQEGMGLNCEFHVTEALRRLGLAQ